MGGVKVNKWFKLNISYCLLKGFDGPKFVRGLKRLFTPEGYV